MSDEIKKELKIYETLYSALSELNKDEQLHAIQWVVERLSIDVPVIKKTNKKDEEDNSNQGSEEPGRGSVKQFIAGKKPATAVERIACLAYYLTHVKKMSEFKTLEITKLNKEAAMPNFSNASTDVRNATNQNGFLASASGGRKQISTRGELLVEALPDRAKVKTVMEENPFKRKRQKKSKTVKK